MPLSLSITPQQHLVGYPKRPDGLELLVTEECMERQEQHGVKTSGHEGGRFRVIPSNKVDFYRPHPSIRLAKNTLLFLFLLPLILDHQGQGGGLLLFFDNQQGDGGD
jgi:hypothetical protein